MKMVRYRTLPAVGRVPSSWREESLSEILLRAPHFPPRDIIPSFDPMADLVGAGRIDGGMSGGIQWKPAIITPREYAMLVRELRDRRPSLRALAAPEWVKTMPDWYLFLEERFDGIPAKLQRPYMHRIAAVRAKLFAAMHRKDKRDIARYTNEEVAIQVEWSAAVEALKLASRRDRAGR